MSLGRDLASKEEPTITRCDEPISYESIKATNYCNWAEEGEAFMRVGRINCEDSDLMRDIEMSGSHGSGLGPFLCKTTGCTGSNVELSFDLTLLEGYEGPLYAKVGGPGQASESVQVGLMVTEEKRIAYVAEQAHLEFLSKFKIVFAAMDKNQDGYVSREDLEKFIEGPEQTREAIEKAGQAEGWDREEIEKFLEKQKHRGAEARRQFISAMADPQEATRAINDLFLTPTRGMGSTLDTLPGAQDLEKINALLALEGDAKLSLDDLGCTS